MAKTVYWAAVRVPEFPRVRFFRKVTGATPPLEDVTGRVVRLELDALDGADGRYVLRRLDAEGSVVWTTLHPSLQEARWHCEFEYGLPEDKWAVT